ncbi:MAG: TonB-dependent receptor [Chitinophagaceae bacterium]|nr:MAG: TonB-dependent receptor [Chitinophagaceae bacterium]
MKRAFAVAAILGCSHAFAQTDSAQRTLPEVVITANKFSKNVNETGKVVTIIGADILRRSTGKTLSDVLNQQAGFAIIGAQNTPGTYQDLYLRGAGTGKTLILIDGIPAYDPSTIAGAFDINALPIENIERVEIVKGALSTLYGSDAVAGVVNVITRKSAEGKVQGTGTIARGSYDTFKGAFSLAGKAKKVAYNASYNRLSAEGMSSAEDTTVSGGFDNDAFRQDAYQLSLGFDISGKVNLRFYGQGSHYKTDLDAGAFTDEKDYTVKWDQTTAGLATTIQYGPANQLFINYNYNSMKRYYWDDSLFVGGFADWTRQQYSGRSHFAEAYTRVQFSQHVEILGGAEWRLQNTDQYYGSKSSFGLYETALAKDSAKVTQTGVYAAFLLKDLSGFNLELGGRYNHHSRYGNNFTWSFNPSYRIAGQVKLFANLATAYKVPSLYQLFDASVGTRTLKPEETFTIDAGVEVRPVRQLMARATYFSRDTKNGLDFNNATNVYFNYNRQKDHGLELELQARTKSYFASANYTWVTGEVNTLNYAYNSSTFGYDVKGDTTYNNLFRRPKSLANVTAGFFPCSNWTVSATYRHVGARQEFIFGGAPTELDAYGTVDFYTEYQVGSSVKLFADLRNMLNQKYTDAYGYNSRRFNFMVGATLNIK